MNSYYQNSIDEKPYNILAEDVSLKDQDLMNPSQLSSDYQRALEHRQAKTSNPFFKQRNSIAKKEDAATRIAVSRQEYRGDQKPRQKSLSNYYTDIPTIEDIAARSKQGKDKAKCSSLGANSMYMNQGLMFKAVTAMQSMQQKMVSERKKQKIQKLKSEICDFSGRNYQQRQKCYKTIDDSKFLFESSKAVSLSHKCRDLKNQKQKDDLMNLQKNISYPSQFDSTAKRGVFGHEQKPQQILKLQTDMQNSTKLHHKLHSRLFSKALSFKQTTDKFSDGISIPRSFFDMMQEAEKEQFLSLFNDHSGSGLLVTVSTIETHFNIDANKMHAQTKELMKFSLLYKLNKGENSEPQSQAQAQRKSILLRVVEFTEDTDTVILPEIAFQTLRLSPNKPVSVCMDSALVKNQAEYLKNQVVYQLQIDALEPNYIELGIQNSLKEDASKNDLVIETVRQKLVNIRLLKVGQILRLPHISKKDVKIYEFQVSEINGCKSQFPIFLNTNPSKIQLELALADFSCTEFSKNSGGKPIKTSDNSHTKKGAVHKGTMLDLDIILKNKGLDLEYMEKVIKEYQEAKNQMVKNAQKSTKKHGNQKDTNVTQQSLNESQMFLNLQKVGSQKVENQGLSNQSLSLISSQDNRGGIVKQVGDTLIHSSALIDTNLAQTFYGEIETMILDNSKIIPNKRFNTLKNVYKPNQRFGVDEKAQQVRQTPLQNQRQLQAVALQGDQKIKQSEKSPITIDEPLSEQQKKVLKTINTFLDWSKRHQKRLEQEANENAQNEKRMQNNKVKVLNSTHQSREKLKDVSPQPIKTSSPRNGNLISKFMQAYDKIILRKQMDPKYQSLIKNENRDQLETYERQLVVEVLNEQVLKSIEIKKSSLFKSSQKSDNLIGSQKFFDKLINKRNSQEKLCQQDQLMKIEEASPIQQNLHLLEQYSIWLNVNQQNKINLQDQQKDDSQYQRRSSRLSKHLIPKRTSTLGIAIDLGNLQQQKQATVVDDMHNAVTVTDLSNNYDQMQPVNPQQILLSQQTSDLSSQQIIQRQKLVINEPSNAETNQNNLEIHRISKTNGADQMQIHLIQSQYTYNSSTYNSRIIGAKMHFQQETSGEIESKNKLEVMVKNRQELAHSEIEVASPVQIKIQKPSRDNSSEENSLQSFEQAVDYKVKNPSIQCSKLNSLHWFMSGKVPDRNFRTHVFLDAGDSPRGVDKDPPILGNYFVSDKDPNTLNKYGLKSEICADKRKELYYLKEPQLAELVKIYKAQNNQSNKQVIREIEIIKHFQNFIDKENGQSSIETSPRTQLFQNVFRAARKNDKLGVPLTNQKVKEMSFDVNVTSRPVTRSCVRSSQDTPILGPSRIQQMQENKKPTILHLDSQTQAGVNISVNQVRPDIDILSLQMMPESVNIPVVSQEQQPGHFFYKDQNVIKEEGDQSVDSPFKMDHKNLDIDYVNLAHQENNPKVKIIAIQHPNLLAQDNQDGTHYMSFENNAEDTQNHSNLKEKPKAVDQQSKSDKKTKSKTNLIPVEWRLTEQVATRHRKGSVNPRSVSQVNAQYHNWQLIKNNFEKLKGGERSAVKICPTYNKKRESEDYSTMTLECQREQKRQIQGSRFDRTRLRQALKTLCEGEFTEYNHHNPSIPSTSVAFHSRHPKKFQQFTTRPTTQQNPCGRVAFTSLDSRNLNFSLLHNPKQKCEYQAIKACQISLVKDDGNNVLSMSNNDIVSWGQNSNKQTLNLTSGKPLQSQRRNPTNEDLIVDHNNRMTPITLTKLLDQTSISPHNNTIPAIITGRQSNSISQS